MKIAVTFENGNVFQHFGHTEQFKVYDVSDGQIAKEEVVLTNGSGLFGGVEGDADSAVKAFLEGNLVYNPDVSCSHHGSGHQEGHCGENKQGCSGNGHCR